MKEVVAQHNAAVTLQEMVYEEKKKGDIVRPPVVVVGRATEVGHGY